ncbi:MAG: flagellar basal body P-ring formation protein FlgA [Spirochaetes bacterium]|nr:flagellar basal body P-ring formation protein FlgA [Spirochaetota bacterium]
MKKIILLLYILILYSHLNSVTLILKDNVIIEANKIMLNDIVKNNKYLDNILIKETNSCPIILFSNEIIDILFKNNIYDTVIIGNSVKINSHNRKLSDQKNFNFINQLESIISNYINSNNFKIKIDLLKISPDIDINLIDESIWILEQINYDLEKIADLKSVKLTYNNKIYDVLIKIHIFSNIYISKKNLLKNEIINPYDFYIKNIDITNLKSIKDIVTDINETTNYQIIKEINPTDFLRWSNLKKTALIKNGDDLTLLLNKDMIEVKIPCIALTDGYNGQKMKVRLKNGNERIGKLKKIEGKFYVEIN